MGASASPETILFLVEELISPFGSAADRATRGISGEYARRRKVFIEVSNASLWAVFFNGSVPEEVCEESPDVSSTAFAFPFLF